MSFIVNMNSKSYIEIKKLNFNKKCIYRFGISSLFMIWSNIKRPSRNLSYLCYSYIKINIPTKCKIIKLDKFIFSPKFLIVNNQIISKSGHTYFCLLLVKASL